MIEQDMMSITSRGEKLRVLLTLIVFLLVGYVAVHVNSWMLALCSSVELIVLFTLLFSINSRVVRSSLGTVLLLLFGVQLVVCFFSGEFISTLMLENASFLGSMSYSLLLALGAFVVATIYVILLFRLYSDVRLRFFFKPLVIIVSLLLYVSVSVGSYAYTSKVYSPLASTMYTLYEEGSTYALSYFESYDKGVIYERYYNAKIQGANAEQCASTLDKPNVVIVFVEGFSFEVMDSFTSLGLRLTPNFNALNDQSLSFKHYFNHTAATYRGLRGQLYSLYQSSGGSSDEGFFGTTQQEISEAMHVKLVSIMDILRQEGYKSVFVNPEPQSAQFAGYVRGLGFDEVVSFDGKGTMTDREAFEFLEELMVQRKQEQVPTLTVLYTLGTHYGLDSPDKKFGNGKNPVYNRFYNCDYWFGEFYNQAQRRGLLENTLLVVTTDHASFPGPEYTEALRSTRKFFVSEVPFMIYWPGVVPRVIDARGRNSLDFAPTVLDCLGVRDYPNYFLGTSLFAEEANDFSRLTVYGNNYFYTKEDGSIVPVKSRDRIKNRVRDYCKISLSSRD